MTDRPIIFSAPMIRALLDGRKTQTRRVLKEQRHAATPAMVDGRWQWLGWSGATLGDVVLRYAPGDRLWVREAFITGYDTDDEFGRPVGDRKIWYRATDRGLNWYDPDTESTLDNPPWKPSIHMPRWASRLTLTVTDVRVQRLQDITEADAVAEGISSYKSTGPDDDTPAADAFMDLWNDIHGIDAWDANPWVCALTFTVRQGNIDT